MGPTNNDSQGMEDKPEWVIPVLAKLDTIHLGLRVGVYGMTKKLLRMLESEMDIQQPVVASTTKGNARLHWLFRNGDTFTLDVCGASEYRYRYRSFGKDSGVVIVTRDYAQRVRHIFHEVFGVNNVTKTSMEFHLGRRYAG